jgi:hypothetical protein
MVKLLLQNHNPSGNARAIHGFPLKNQPIFDQMANTPRQNGL